MIVVGSCDRVSGSRGGRYVHKLTMSCGMHPPVNIELDAIQADFTLEKLPFQLGVRHNIGLVQQPHDICKAVKALRPKPWLNG